MESVLTLLMLGFFQENFTIAVNFIWLKMDLMRVTAQKLEGKVGSYVKGCIV